MSLFKFFAPPEWDADVPKDSHLENLVKRSSIKKKNLKTNDVKDIQDRKNVNDITENNTNSFDNTEKPVSKNSKKNKKRKNKQNKDSISTTSLDLPKSLNNKPMNDPNQTENVTKSKKNKKKIKQQNNEALNEKMKIISGDGKATKTEMVLENDKVSCEKLQESEISVKKRKKRKRKHAESNESNGSKKSKIQTDESTEKINTTQRTVVEDSTNTKEMKKNKQVVNADKNIVDSEKKLVKLNGIEKLKKNKRKKNKQKSASNTQKIFNEPSQDTQNKTNGDSEENVKENQTNDSLKKPIKETSESLINKKLAKMNNRDRKRKENLIEKLKNIMNDTTITSDEKLTENSKAQKSSPKSTSMTPKTLRQRMMEKLKGARFRYLNEQMYSKESKDAKQLFNEDPSAFNAYHDGYRQQVSKWPLNPLDNIIENILKLPKEYVIADLGCGDGRLAKSVPQKVHSFDLVALNPTVQACDMSHTPLLSSHVNVVVFCLSLMGTNLKDYVIEANRILKIGGQLKIAEVESRFDDVDEFTKGVQKYGFSLVKSDLTQNLFYFMDFKKESDIKKRNKLPELTLKACLYKKR